MTLGTRVNARLSPSMKQKVTLVLAWCCTTLWAPPVLAGPPYDTDDPEPVEYRHWEFYVASQSLRDRVGFTGTAPHVEVNYGVFPNVQLHVIVPLAYAAPNRGNDTYGVGDTELGVKLRFIQEQTWIPQVGTFPFLEAPTGSQARGLGNGSAQIFVPIWLQKSFGTWTTYGGGGYWRDLGQNTPHWWYFGWLLQKRLVDGFTLGTEVFHLTQREPGTERDTRFNLGAIMDFNDEHHLLFSAGRGLTGPIRFQSYLAYQLTIGPDE